MVEVLNRIKEIFVKQIHFKLETGKPLNLDDRKHIFLLINEIEDIYLALINGLFFDNNEIFEGYIKKSINKN